MKIQCIHCLETKDSIHFHVHNRSKLGFRTVCKQCRKEEEKKYRQGEYLERIKITQKEYRDTHKKEIAAYSIKNKTYTRYHITAEQYNKAMSSSCVCQICGADKQLNYDHDHNKKGIDAFRGVLYRRCNLSIGAFGDSQELLQNAIDYLKWNR